MEHKETGEQEKPTIAEAVRAYYERLWGPPAHVRSFWYDDDHCIDVLRWEASTHPFEVNVYATVGASMFPLADYPSSHRFEFLIGLLPAKDDVEGVLANVAIYSHRYQKVIGPGHTITWTDEPLWPGTEMHSILMDDLDEDFLATLVIEGEEQPPIHIEFLDITLLYPSEVAYVKQHSRDALYEHWEKHDVAYVDPNRPPEPA